MSLVHARRRWPSPAAVAMFLNVAVLAVLSALMAAGVARTLAERSIRTQLGNLQDNLSQLAQAQQTNLDRLHAQLRQAQADLSEAEAANPKLGAPYQIFERGFALGDQTGVEVDRIQHNGTTTQTSALGPLSVASYSIDLVGSPESCLAYIRQLEAEGRPFLATDGINLQVDPPTCRLGVAVLGTSPAGLPTSP